MKMNYLFGWEDIPAMLDDFGAADNALEGCELIFAIYLTESYEGKALVVWKKGESLYLNTANHCSCYRLENGWSPEETTKTVIEKQLDSWFRLSDDEENKYVINKCKMILEQE